MTWNSYIRIVEIRDESEDDRDQEMDKGNKYKEDENNEIAFQMTMTRSLSKGSKTSTTNFPTASPIPKTILLSC